ncbi:MAG: magnesium transporter [Phycisphaerae bacterium]|nr:magnesium transporter [Phycisphaerae bacterium]
MAEEQEILLDQVKQLLAAHDTERLRRLLGDQRTSYIAEITEILDPEDCRVIFNCLNKSDAAEVFEKVDEATRSELFDFLDDEELVDLISELDPDDAADVLAELDKKDSREVLESLDVEDAEQIKELMDYSEDSAGGIMDPVVLSVSEEATVNEAIQRIQEAEVDEDFYTVFVVDKHRRFLGDVRIRLLITHRGDQKIKDLIDTDTLFVSVDDDQEDVYNLFKKNDLIVVPVLDKDHRLIGRITANRIIEVAEEEAAEDLYAMAGTDAAELETVSIFNAARIRMTWLLPCLAGTAITAMVGFSFKSWFNAEGQAGKEIFLVAFLFAPMIAAISGNAGLQTSAIVISGLATGDLAALKLSQVFMREARIALLVALCCGLIGGSICSVLPNFFDRQFNADSASEDLVQQAEVDVMPEIPALESNQYVRIAIAFGFAMFSAIMVSTTLGLFLPFVFRRIGLDPAISSGPLVTTANDSISVTIYLFLTMFLTV